MRIIILLLLFSILSADVDNYSVRFLGIEVATVSITVSDTIINDFSYLMLLYEAKSSLFFYNVINHYKTIIHPETQNIISYNKHSIQPGFEDYQSTFLTNDTLKYDFSQRVLPPNYYNIFSLLHYIAQNKVNDLLTVNVEREGYLYQGEILPNEKTPQFHEYLIKLNLDSQYSEENFEQTDIFTWGAFLPTAERRIWVDVESSKIFRCKFSFGLINLTAKLQP